MSWIRKTTLTLHLGVSIFDMPLAKFCIRTKPSGHMTLIQRPLNVDATSWRCIHVEPTLYKHHVPAGKASWSFRLFHETSQMDLSYWKDVPCSRKTTLFVFFYVIWPTLTADLCWLVIRRSRVWSPLGPATFFCGDWPRNIFYSHLLPSADSRRAVDSLWWKNVHKYWLTT